MPANARSDARATTSELFTVPPWRGSLLDGVRLDTSIRPALESRSSTPIPARGRGDSMITLSVNGKPRTVDVDPDTPLLYVLRDDVELHGPKFGCGLGQCGACT